VVSPKPPSLPAIPPEKDNTYAQCAEIEMAKKSKTEMAANFKTEHNFFAEESFVLIRCTAALQSTAGFGLTKR
jgi:hypothetical protein